MFDFDSVSQLSDSSLELEELDVLGSTLSFGLLDFADDFEDSGDFTDSEGETDLLTFFVVNFADGTLGAFFVKDFLRSFTGLYVISKLGLIS